MFDHDADIIGSSSPDAIYLGRHYDRKEGVGPKFMYGGERHIVLIGPNGKGKSVSLLFPNLLRLRNRSIVVVDIKGELAAVTALFRSTVGKVRIINPFGLHADLPGFEFMRSAGFNPLGHLDPSAPSFNRDAARLAEALITVSPEERDPHWPLSGRALLAAIIMFVAIEARAAGEQPSMRRVRALLCQASDGPSHKNPQGVGLPKLAADMIELGLRDAWSRKNYAGLVNKAGQFKDYTREVQSIASTARIQTEPFDDPEIIEDMECDPFDFSYIKKHPTTVYIVLPVQELERQAKWLRMILTAAFHGVMRPRAPGEPRTLFILDEFFACGKLDVVETVWALVRGFGIQIMPILQYVGQLELLYPKLWEGLLGMAGAVLSFGSNDQTTIGWLIKQTGNTTREVTSYNDSRSVTISEGQNNGGGSNPGGGTSSWGESAGRSESSSQSSSTSVIQAPVITAQTIRGLRSGFMLGFFDGVKNAQSIYAPAYWDAALIARRAYANPYNAEDMTRLSASLRAQSLS